MKKAIFSLAVFVTMCCLASCGGKTTSTTVTKEASVKVGDFEYSVIYTVINGAMTLISCSIRKEIYGVINEVGNIRKENGQVNLFLLDTEDYIAHAEQFKAIVIDIEKEVQPIEG